jgi:hypothetical protein
MKFLKLSESKLKDKYFYRTEPWDWLDDEMIYVMDTKSPRMITMDPWPQQIYLDAKGDLTIEDYIIEFSKLYPKGQIPERLDEDMLDVLSGLIDDEKIVQLSNQPVQLEESILNPISEEGVIDLKGEWFGSYTYNIPDEFKNDKMIEVNFRIHIEEVIGNKFSGKVEDVLETGGTPGIGTVNGKFTETKIQFDKNMPIKVEIDEKLNTFIYENEKHPTIVYKGEFSKNKKHIYGEWEFKKKRFSWKRIIPFWVSSWKGGFKMTKIE